MNSISPRTVLRALVCSAIFMAETCLPLTAQDTATAPVNGTPTTLADLAPQPKLWPAQVTLTSDVKMVILSNGKEAGSITSPAGSTVNLVAVTPTGLQLQVMQATATVPAEQTDLWKRVATLASKPTTNMASSLPTLPPSVTPPPPKPPAPVQPPLSASRSFDSAPDVNSHAVEYSYEVPPRDNFDKAAFHFWSPDTKDPIRGIILLTPGSNGDGRGMTGSAEWQALARKYHMALVADCLQSKGRDYCDATAGSGQAVFDALKQFAQMSNHPEVERAPLALYGESAGGQFDYNFTLWKPERVICFVVNKGGYYSQSGSTSLSRVVPGIFFLGLSDADYRVTAINAIWTEGRDHGARWAIARQPNSGHEFSKTAAVARAFFEPVFKLRLPEESLSSDDSSALKPIEETQGWLGDVKTCEIRDNALNAQSDRKAAWLPDENSAKVWKSFVSK